MVFFGNSTNDFDNQYEEGSPFAYAEVALCL